MNQLEIKTNKKQLPENKTWFDLQYESTSSLYINSSKCAIIDCDGVITDGKSIYNKTEKIYKIYGAYDKEILNFLSKSFNWKFIFVSDDKAGLEITQCRINHLIKSNKNISFENLNDKERFNLLKEIKKTNKYDAFIGDSLSDIPSLSLAYMSGCPNNAPNIVKEYCNYVSNLDGGNGGLADILWNIHTYIVNIVKLYGNIYGNNIN